MFFYFRCEDEMIPAQMDLVGGLTYGPGPFNVRIRSRIDL